MLIAAGAATAAVIVAASLLRDSDLHRGKLNLLIGDAAWRGA